MPATAASAAPITKVREMVRSMSMPSSARHLPVLLAGAHARGRAACASTSQVKTASTPSVSAMMSIWM